MFIKTTFKDLVKELETMHLNAIYICISWYNKSCWKNATGSRNHGVCHVIWRYNHVKFHHCKICVTDFRNGGKPFASHLWAPRKGSFFSEDSFHHLLNNFLDTARQSPITRGSAAYHLSQPSFLTTTLLLMLMRHHHSKSKLDTKYFCDCDLWLRKNKKNIGDNSLTRRSIERLSFKTAYCCLI